MAFYRSWNIMKLIILRDPLKLDFLWKPPRTTWYIHPLYKGRRKYAFKSGRATTPLEYLSLKREAHMKREAGLSYAIVKVQHLLLNFNKRLLIKIAWQEPEVEKKPAVKQPKLSERVSRGTRRVVNTFPSQNSGGLQKNKNNRKRKAASCWCFQECQPQFVSRRVSVRMWCVLWVNWPFL